MRLPSGRSLRSVITSARKLPWILWTVLAGDGQGGLLLALLCVVQVQQGPAQVIGLTDDGGTDGVGSGLDIVREGGEANLLLLEEGHHTASVGEQTFGTAEAQAVETGEGADDMGGETPYKREQGELLG